MAQRRLPMHKIRDVLRLSAAGLSKRQIAASVGVGPTAVGECQRRAREAGLGWPLADDLDEAALEQRLYPPVAVLHDRPEPDWVHVHRELKRKGATLLLQWEKYRSVQPDGYSRSRFCELYRRWQARLSPTMRQTHMAGEKLLAVTPGSPTQFSEEALRFVFRPSKVEFLLFAIAYSLLGASCEWTSDCATSEYN